MKNIVQLKTISLDKKIAYSGLIISFLLTLISFRLRIGVGLSLTFLFSTFAYILIDSRQNKKTLIPKLDKTLDKSYMIILFIILTSVFLLLFTIEQTSSRNLFEFIYISLLIGFIAIEVCSLVGKPTILLIQIILVSIIIIVSGILVYPNIGSDQLFHISYMTQMIEKGYVPYDTTYKPFPLMHIGLAIFSLLTSFCNEQLLLICFVAIPYTILNLITFVLGNKIMSVKKSLFAMLFLCTNTWYIYWGIYSVPMTYSFSIYILSVYLFLNRLLNSSIEKTITLFILMFAIITSHPLVALSYSIFLITIYIIYNIQKIYLKKETGHDIKCSSIILFVVAFIGHSLYNAHSFLENRIFSLFADSDTTIGILKLSSQKSLLIYEFDYIGLYLLYILSIFGILQWMKKGLKNYPISTIITSLAVLYLFIAYISWIMGIKSVIPHRWLLYATIFLVYPASEGISFIVQKIKSVHLKYTTIFIIIALISFFNLNSSIINVDSPLFGKEDAIRMQLKTSEVYSAKFISSKFDGTIYSDFMHKQYFDKTLMLPVNKSLLLSDASMINDKNRGDIFVIRNYAFHQPVQQPTYRLDHELLEMISVNSNKIYYNGDVALIYQ